MHRIKTALIVRTAEQARNTNHELRDPRYPNMPHPDLHVIFIGQDVRGHQFSNAIVSWDNYTYIGLHENRREWLDQVRMRMGDGNIILLG